MSELVDILLRVAVPLKEARGMWRELRHVDKSNMPCTRAFLQGLSELDEVTRED